MAYFVHYNNKKVFRLKAKKHFTLVLHTKKKKILIIYNFIAAQ